MFTHSMGSSRWSSLARWPMSRCFSKIVIRTELKQRGDCSQPRESRLAFAAISTRNFCFFVLGSIDWRLTSSCTFLWGTHWLAAWRDTSLFPQHVRLERNYLAFSQEGGSSFFPVLFLKKTSTARLLCFWQEILLCRRWHQYLCLLEKCKKLV